MFVNFFCVIKYYIDYGYLFFLMIFIWLLNISFIKLKKKVYLNEGWKMIVIYVDWIFKVCYSLVM